VYRLRPTSISKRAGEPVKGNQMHISRVYRQMSLLGCCLLLFLAACGAETTTANSPLATSRSQGATSATPIGSTPAQTTVPMPPTQTSCPVSGAARAAVMVPFVSGGTHTIVYTVNTSTHTVPTSGILRRYDVKTGNKTDIVKFPNTSISEAQVSAISTRGLIRKSTTCSVW
jgi:flagellar basal body L-ring protein FlgH